MPKTITIFLAAAILVLTLLTAEGSRSSSEADSLAAHYLQQADSLRRQDDLAGWAYAWWDWQAALFDDSRAALALLDTVVHTAWRAPQTTEEAEAMLWVQVNRGYHLFQLGRVLASVKAYEEALKWYQNFPIRDFEALDYLYLPLGAHYTRLGDNEKARALYLNAIAKHPEGPRDAALAGLYNNLGLTYWNEGDQESAVKIYETGLACEGLLPVKSGLLHFSLAQSLLAAGRYPEASTHVETAIATLQNLTGEEAQPDYLSGAYAVKAKLLSQGGKAASALAYLKKALAFIKTARSTAQHRDVAKIQVEMGRLHLQTGDETRALELFNAALASLIPGFRSEDPMALPGPDQLYEENAIFEALEGKADALAARYAREKDPGDLRRALECHQLAARVEIQLRRLLQYESSKISLLSQSRQRTAKFIAIARELYSLTGDDHFLYAAWAAAEQVKSVLLLEAVQANRFQGMLAENDTLMIESRRFRQQTAYFERLLLLEPGSPLRGEWIRQREELMQLLAENEDRLRERYPAWAELRSEAEGFSEESIRTFRSALSQYTLVEYFAGEDRIEVFAQSPDGKSVWKTIPHADLLSAETQAFLSLLQSRTALQTPGPYREAAHHLYNELLAPVLSALEGRPKNLLIVPDAWLAFLPFEALYDEPAAGEGWDRAPFLLRRFGIHYAFSLAVLESQRNLHTKAQRNIAQFSPRFQEGQRGLAPLLNSAEEAPVADMCKSDLFTDERARLEELRRSGGSYGVLHLSTHAAVDTGGLLPHVEFYDRSAYLPDIYALSLKADLVVLSACQTALGQFRNGEGVMSLSRAFAYAGGKGLVAGLWTINEGATAGLLRRMYAELRDGAPKPAALQRAKLQYLDDPAVPAFEKSPYYWAGLVYTGDEAPVHWKNCGPSPWWALLLLLPLSTILFHSRKR